MNSRASSPLPRRVILRGGLATFASLMGGRLLSGCSSPAPTDAGTDAGPELDAVLGSDAPLVDAHVSPDAFVGTSFQPNALGARPALRSLIDEIGALEAANADGLRLPPGFTARIVAVSGEMVPGTSYEWHTYPDGGVCFPLPDGGWVYTSNSEFPFTGGVGALRFDRDGVLVSATRILDGTNINCAGGDTPWGSWLSCEEIPRGLVWETDPLGIQAPQARPALGCFKHEAVCVDPGTNQLYLTEDESTGCFYRFTPMTITSAGHADLRAGRLEVAQVTDGAVTWHEIPDPQFTGSTPVREQVDVATHFRGGEGIWFHAGVVYFSTKGDNNVRAFDVATQRIRVLYDAATSPDPILSGVDNLTVTCCGDVIVAEDGGDMQIVAILPDGTLRPLVQVVGQDGSEIAGPAFDPSGTRLYFSSQRGGTSSRGITYVIEGPFHAPV